MEFLSTCSWALRKMDPVAPAAVLVRPLPTLEEPPNGPRRHKSSGSEREAGIVSDRARVDRSAPEISAKAAGVDKAQGLLLRQRPFRWTQAEGRK